MFRVAFTITAACLLSSIVWFFLFSGFLLFLNFGGPGYFLGFSAGDEDLAPLIKTALVVGLAHGMLIAIGSLLAKPESLFGALVAGLIATEALLLVLIVLWGAISMMSSGAQITITLLDRLGSNLATVFLILSLIFLVPTAAVAAGLLKIQGIIGGGQ